jgi:hypothetical protein
LQAHYQSPTSQHFNHCFVKELAKLINTPPWAFHTTHNNKINLFFVDKLVRIDKDNKINNVLLYDVVINVSHSFDKQDTKL